MDGGCYVRTDIMEVMRWMFERYRDIRFEKCPGLMKCMITMRIMNESIISSPAPFGEEKGKKGKHSRYTYLPYLSFFGKTS